MTASARRSVSYLPGRWTAVVTDGLSLLADVAPADPLLAACWEADGADALLEVLARPEQPHAPSFVLAAAVGDGVRLVVAGGAHAEVFTAAGGSAEPVVLRAGGGGWSDQLFDRVSDVRLVADDPTPFERIAPLPLTTGIVLASYVFTTAVATPPPPVAPEDDAVGWIPLPLPQPSTEFPIPEQRWDEPSPVASGVFRALPWRSSIVEPDAPEGGVVPPEDVDAPDAAPAAEQLPSKPLDEVAPAQDVPSFGAPGYEPPPFGAEAWDADTPSDYAYPPPPPPPPAGDHPGATLVQAVHCPNGHPNPLHIEACRICGSGFAPQQPVTVERPPLGVLRLSTGEEIPLDRDALLGRAPFAVDQRSVRLVEVPSPNNDISRSHVRITLDGWQVFATDLGSTNGTAVALPGQPEALLRPHDPFALAPGSVLLLADEAQARFDVG